MELDRLVKQLEALSARLEKLEHERDSYRQLYELARVELEKLRRHIFGRKAERVSPNQTQLALDVVFEAMGIGPIQEQSGSQDPASPSEEAKKKRKHTPHGRQKLPETLLQETIELLPPEVLAEGRQAFRQIGEEKSEAVEWRPGRWVRLLWLRPKFIRIQELTSQVESACSPLEPKVLIAELADQPFARSKAGPGLLARVLVSKYGDSLPLYRQQRIFAREGMTIARSTLCGWVESCAGVLSPIVEAMASDCMNAAWIGIDATGVLVQKKERCRKGYFWVLVAERNHVLFRYTRHHNQDGPKTFLSQYKGYVQADAAPVYHALYRECDVTEVGCWCHCRRYFFDSLSSDKQLAMHGIELIGKLFEIDRSLKELPPAERKRRRLILSAPIVDAFEAWVEQQSLVALSKSPIGQAFTYAKNQKAALRRFLQDGRLRLDNNLSELELRRQAIGRKNWLFVGSDEGAEWNTVIVSLIASCQLHQIDPYQYLREALLVVGSYSKKRVLELSPKYWRQTRERLIAEGKLSPSPDASEQNRPST